MPNIVKSEEANLMRIVARVFHICHPFSLACVAATGMVIAGCGGGGIDSGTPTSTPRFSPGPGTYSSPQTVTVSDLTIGSTVYCTVDGSTPSTSSAPCQEPITVSASETIKAIATTPYHTQSAVASAAFVINLPPAAMPTFSPAAGAYTSNQSVTISDATSNALIYYTTDGSTPTTSSTLYTGPIAVTSSETLKAIALQSAYSASAVASATYIIQLPAPTPIISTSTGSNNTIYGTPLSVTITDADAKATIFYAIGTAATTSSTKYTGPITISSPTMINAIAVDATGGYSQSAQASSSFTVTEAAPTFSQQAGTIRYGSQVALGDADPKATIHYTLDGSTATTSSPAYTAPITVTSNEAIHAIAVNPASGYLASANASAAYALPKPTSSPVISAAGGVTTTVYPSTFAVSISDSVSGATIYFTTDGSTPSITHGAQYTGSFKVTQTETVEAIAIDTADGAPPSATATQLFTVQEAAPVISPAAGAVRDGSLVTISDADPGAIIYYTLNGIPASTSATPYTSPIAISNATTVNAVAINAGATTNYVQSKDVSATYTLQQPAPAPVISTSGGATSAVYPNSISASITDADSTAAIYYTLDGSVPSATNGTKYSGAFKVTSTETISAVAVDPSHAFANSAVSTQAVTIVETPPIFKPTAGSIASGATVAITDADPGATIYYTMNGSVATTASTRYTGPIPITTSLTINAVAANNAPKTIYTQSADVSSAYVVAGSIPAPVISAAGSITTITHPGSFQISLSDSDAAASIYYTTDGSTPSSTHGTKYAAAFAISSTLTVNAIAIDTAKGTNPSSVSSQLFTVIEATPAISPSSGTITPGAKVTITDIDSSATIYYSINGKAATTSSTLYTGPFAIASATTVNAVAINTAAGTNYLQSVDASAVYTLTSAPPAPVISTAEGATAATYPDTIQVTISDTDSSASIYYTSDGSTPSKSNGTLYGGPFNAGSTGTIKAVAVDPAYTDNSAVASQSITITEAAPTFSPAAGLISTGAKVAIQDADADATIHYTTNGSAATTSSAVYSSPITITSSTTIHAVAIDLNSGSLRGLSAQASASYTPYSGTTISGTVLSGSLPIVGASVHLVAAGASGYGSGSAALNTSPASLVTDSAGGFSFGYTCPAAPGDQIYLVASGGSTVSGDSNPSIALMVALGTCSKLATNTSATINELTTVAAAYSLSGFSAADSSGGIDVGAPAPSTTCNSGGARVAGKSTCNYRGLANAFLTPANLVDPATGLARTITPFYNGSDPRNPNGWSSSYGDPLSPCPGKSCLSPNNPVPDTAFNTSTAPYQRVNTLGNVLASCVEAKANCNALFALTDAASDTLQAALYIAQHPFTWSGTAGLYALISNPASAFTPPYGNPSSTLSSEPNDWALAITITGGGLGHSNTDSGDSVVNQGIAIDGQGNVWITAVSTVSDYVPPTGGNFVRHVHRKGEKPEVITTSGYWAGMIAGFDPIGEALTPPTSVVNGTIAYDAANGFTSYGGYGPDLESANGLDGAFRNPYSFLIDASQNIWVNNNVSEFSDFPVGPAGGSMVAIAATPAPGSENLTLSATSPDSNFPNTMYSLVDDSSANMWGSSGAGIGGLIYAWNSAGIPNPDSPWFINFNPNITVAGTLCNMIFDTNGTLWGDDCGYADDNGQVFAVSLPDTSSTSSSANILGDYQGAETEYSPSGTLAPGAGGNVYACDNTQKQYLVFNSSNLSKPVSTLKPSAGRCGQYLTVDGAGHIWTYSVTTNGPVLDEIDSKGNSITPASGLTGTSAEEQSVTGIALFNGSAVNGQGGLLGGQEGGMATDASGNLWFLNGETGQGIPSLAPANALVEIIGVAAPTVTPTAVVTQNGVQGTKP